ncbi:MAG: PQQ-binding-like beta-propeller repeat protein, partial [Planctomycetota bacterium]
MRSCKRTRWAKAVAACLAVLGTVVHAAAAERLDSRELLVTAGAEHGIIVQLGLGNAKQCLDLQADGRYVVQGLDRDAARVAAAREQLQAAGLQCSVSVRALSGNELPYGDNLVNLLVVDDPLGISQEEMLRVVRPLGLLIVREGDSWKRIEKPWPTELDEWTHFLRDATGNPVSHDDEVGPPRHLRWSAGPMWARSHEMNNSFPALVTAKGRMFYIFDKGVTGMEDPRLGEKWTLIARDAFNGTHLWERPLPTWGSQVWRSRALRFFGGNMARRLVADGDKLYVTFEYGGPVAILDAATGKDLGTIPGTDGAEEILAAGDQLFVVSVQQPAPKKSTTEIICYEPAVETVRWRVDVNRCVPQLTCVGDNEVIYHNRQEVVSLSRQDGSVRWQSKGEAGGPLGGPKMMLLAGDKVVVSAGKIIARSLADGSQLWEAPGPKGDSMRDSDLFVVRDAVWCSGPDGTVVGYRLDDGKPAQTVDAEAVQSYGHHLRCYRAKATDRHLITQYRGVEFLSLEDEAHCENDWIRGTCTYGVMPANGLLYVPPHSCLCYAGAMLRGLNAFAGADGVADEQAPEFNVGALEKGPAFDRTALAPPSAKAQAPEKAWPSYRHDAPR